MVKTRDVNNDWRHRGSKYCRECNCSVQFTHWLQHLAKKSHLDNANKRLGLSRKQRLNSVSVPEPTFRGVFAGTVENQIRYFKDEVLMRNKDLNRIYAEVVSDLMELLRKTFGYCEFHTYGSMLTGLALKGSDLDLYVDTCDFKHSCDSLSSDHKIQSKVYTCSEAFYSSKKFGDTNPIFGAKVPIVTTIHLPTRTKCDVSFSSAIGREHCQLLRFYLNLDPRFLDVMLVIKFWAKKRGICNGRDYISSFAWNLLFIGYLQCLKWSDGIPIPSVMEMQNENTPGRIVNECRVDFQPKTRSVVLPDKVQFSHLGLLTGFFVYYRNFSFQDDVVCPYLGTPVARTAMPTGMIPYKISRHAADIRENAKLGGRFLRIIQDPFNHKSLLVCPTHRLPCITAYISAAATICEEHMKMGPKAESKFLNILFG